VDALALCWDLQSKHNALVLILAREEDVQWEIHCLEAGADDYLPKPFFPQQLLAHIHAVSRRARATLKMRPSSVVTVGPICIDSLRNSATAYGKMVQLTPTESKLLHMLAVNANDVCTADQIVTHIWGYDDADAASLIRSLIRRLRKKLEPDPSKPRFIVTVPKIGYMLVRQPEEPVPALVASRTPGGNLVGHNKRQLVAISAGTKSQRRKVRPRPALVSNLPAASCP
jgi:DNA-binding response OmpR family regulator